MMGDDQFANPLSVEVYKRNVTPATTHFHREDFNSTIDIKKLKRLDMDQIYRDSSRVNSP